jgi:Protein of unknown function (DUF1549)/Protein of unknown function (DUF1553)
MQLSRITRFIAIGFAVCPFLSTSSATAGVDMPGGGKIETVDFERHVMGLFTKAACNNGSCHGSFQGKNGFRLSLFAFDADRDHAALTREILGRRVDKVDPDASLLLLKATGAIKHDGSARFSKGSWQYNIFREWINQGCNWTAGSGKVVSLSMTPKEYVLVESGKKAQVRVTAKFADGSEEDITPFCDYRVQDDAIASMSILGEISANKPGDSGLVISYRGNVVAARILVPAPAKPGFQYPKMGEVNYIDREVTAKLRMLNMVPSEKSSDNEFIRRVYIDTIGILPTPEEARAFFEDKRADKRERKIDELLAHPLHAALWATKLSDVTGNNTAALENPVQYQPVRSQQWHDWLRKRIAENMPYDEIVKNILTATSREGMTADEWIAHVKKVDDGGKTFDTNDYANRKTLDLFWRRQQNVPPDQWSQKVAAAFLGVRLECCECHKHPTDRWTQADYRSFANVFTQITFNQNAFSSTDTKKVVDALNAERRGDTTVKKNNNQILLVRELWIGGPQGKGGGAMVDPITGRSLKPKAPLGPEFDMRSGKDVRVELVEWLRSPDNPFFAKSFVNRIWAQYFGLGLVDPVDDFSLANAPTNARLLDALAKDFIDSKFDIRAIEKRILMSRTYQQSATPNDSNKFDKNNYARSYVRPMMAEVVVDVLNSALGVQETPGNDVPSGKRIIEIGSSRFANQNVAYALRIFGRPPRTTACDCERTMEPALPQTLYRMTDSGILQKLRNNNSRLFTLLRAKKSDTEIMDELFLATLTRLPNEEEKAAFAEHIKDEKDRTSACVDVLWALINTREFVLNH